MKWNFQYHLYTLLSQMRREGSTTGRAALFRIVASNTWNVRSGRSAERVSNYLRWISPFGLSALLNACPLRAPPRLRRTLVVSVNLKLQMRFPQTFLLAVFSNESLHWLFSAMFRACSIEERDIVKPSMDFTGLLCHLPGFNLEQILRVWNFSKKFQGVWNENPEF